MKAIAINVLNSFCHHNPLAWATFERVSPNTRLVDFAFVQDRGSFVATDSEGGVHSFRMFRDAIVALISPNGQFAFVDGEAVTL